MWLSLKRWFYTQLILGLYHHANIMTQDFTVEFIDNPLIRLVANMLIKLGFYHPHGGLDI